MFILPIYLKFYPCLSHIYFLFHLFWYPVSVEISLWNVHMMSLWSLPILCSCLNYYNLYKIAVTIRLTNKTRKSCQHGQEGSTLEKMESHKCKWKIETILNVLNFKIGSVILKMKNCLFFVANAKSVYMCEHYASKSGCTYNLYQTIKK